jgi:cytochrome c oxidase assembly protein subunit 15
MFRVLTPSSQLRHARWHVQKLARTAATAGISLSSPASYPSVSTALGKPDKLLSYWLLTTASAVFGMVVLGGVTRLTRSGLSMVDWKPEQNFPPMNQQEWDAEFEKYKQFPEYKVLNRGMSLDEFKKIYYMEWAHRTYGRGLGILYGVPMLYFLLSGRAKRAGGVPLQAKLLGLLVMGGSQGLVGWWMVKSGLEEPLIVTKEPRVSPYRLCAHLTMAVGLYSGLIWVGLTTLRPQPVLVGGSPSFRFASTLTAALVGTTLFSGAFVAGNDAGRAFNDWPFFAGNWIPEGIWKERLGWKNLTENTATVQFDHRMLAYGTLAATTALWIRAESQALSRQAIMGFRHLAGFAWLQAGLGIVTLMTVVPVSLGSAHQAGALTVWTTALYCQHALRYVK